MSGWIPTRLVILWLRFLRRFVCRRKGHAIILTQTQPPWLDAYQYAGSCERCCAHWPTGLTVTGTTLAAVASLSSLKVALQDYLDKYAEELKWTP